MIGNYHVVTDWCDDSGQQGIEQSASAQALSLLEHNDDSDLCGHCGHLGFNLQAVAVHDLQVVMLVDREKPVFVLNLFKSLEIAPPTPPPVVLS